MTDNTDYKRAMFEKAVILSDLIEHDADNELIGLTVKMLALDYLQFCKQVGLDAIHPMSREKIELARAAAEPTVN